jgi:hypothetical protein
MKKIPTTILSRRHGEKTKNRDLILAVPLCLRASVRELAVFYSNFAGLSSHDFFYNSLDKTTWTPPSTVPQSKPWHVLPVAADASALRTK